MRFYLFVNIEGEIMMKAIPELYWLALIALATLLMWVPYIFESFIRRGIFPTMGNPSPSDPIPPAWADRAKRAHLNGIDNLVVFAPLVLSLAASSMSNGTTLLAAKVYVFARLAHYVVYIIGIPILRTALFLAGVGATVVMGLYVLSAVG
jgi:uncharacterized MAPEG superfamily protein